MRERASAAYQETCRRLPESLTSKIIAVLLIARKLQLVKIALQLSVGIFCLPLYCVTYILSLLIYLLLVNLIINNLFLLKKRILSIFVNIIYIVP